jgi:hypothetical protein
MNRVILFFWIVVCALAESVVAQQLAGAGFVDVTVPPGFSVVANPMGTLDNSVAALFRSSLRGMPEGTAILKINENGATNSPLSGDFGKALVEGILGKFPATLGGSVGLRLDNGELMLEWDGVLQTALEASGPYETVAQASSPLQFTPTQGQQFWRSQISTDLTPALFSANVFQAGEWSDPTQLWLPGEGVLLFNPGPNAFVLSFLGRILDGRLLNPIPANWSLRANMVGLTGGLTTDAGLELSPGDHIFLWEQGSLQQFTYQSGRNWIPYEPQTRAAQAFFIHAKKPILWEQDYSVFR